MSPIMNIPVSSPLSSIVIALAMLASLAGCARQAAPVVPPPAPIISDDARLPEMTERKGAYFANKIATFREQNPTVPANSVVFLGDSITDRFDVATAFPGQPVVNRGIGGDSLDGLAARIGLSVGVLQPRTVFVMIGINDIVFTDASIENMLERYAAILDSPELADPRRAVYVVSVLPVRTPDPTHNMKVLALNNGLRRVAAERNRPYVDLWNLLRDDRNALREELTTDGIHLNAAGYAIIQARLAPLVTRP